MPGSGYSRVNNDSVESLPLNEGTNEKSPAWPLHRGRWRWRILLWRIIQILACVSGGLILIAIIYWAFTTLTRPARGFSSNDVAALIEQQVSHVQHGNRKSCNCGESIAEARAMGCKYDSIMTAWLPDHCRDDELTEEFNNAGFGPNGEWEYYSDLEKTHRLSLEEVANLADVGGLFFVTQGWHVRHCHFVWRKQFRTRWTKIQISLRDDNEMHIMHCMGMAEKRDPLDRITTGAGVALHADRMEAHEMGGHEGHRKQSNY